MKKRNVILGIVSAFLLLLITGCGSKNAISSAKFMSVADDYDCSITDVINQFEQYGTISEAYVATNTNDWQVEFYVLNSEDSAISMFNTNKTIFESYKSGKQVETSTNMNNYATYSLTTNGHYMYLSYVDNTLVYVRVNDTYKDVVKEFIDDLGY